MAAGQGADQRTYVHTFKGRNAGMGLRDPHREGAPCKAPGGVTLLDKGTTLLSTCFLASHLAERADCIAIWETLH